MTTFIAKEVSNVLPGPRPRGGIIRGAVLEPDEGGEEHGEGDDGDADDHGIHGLRLLAFCYEM